MDSAKPLLIFPRPELVDTPRGYGGGLSLPRPIDSVKRSERIKNRFEQAINHIQDTPGDLNRVLVIETVGQFQDFHKAVNKIDGLEWSGEFEVDEVNLDEMYEPGSDDYKAASSRVASGIFHRVISVLLKICCVGISSGKKRVS